MCFSEEFTGFDTLSAIFCQGVAALSGRSSLIRHIQHICLGRVEQKTRFQREAMLLGHEGKSCKSSKTRILALSFLPPGCGEISQEVQIG